jgi:peptide/nickel transport system substrate-binding protein
MRKLFTLLSLLILASMILAACGGGAPATQPPAPQTEEPSTTEEPSATEPPAATEAPASGIKSKDPTSFIVATIGEPETLDPALDYETAGGDIIQNVYETLVFYDGEATDKFVPQLAESWEVSDDGTVYTTTSVKV